MKQWGQCQPNVDDWLPGLPNPYQHHEIGTFNTCSWGLTHRSLTDIGGGYNLGGAGLPHTTPRPSQPTISTFHLRAPPGLQIIQNLPHILRFKLKGPMAATWSSDHLTIYHGLQLRLAIANDLFLAIGSTRIDRKVTLCN
jgi:hypothetical protein